MTEVLDVAYMHVAEPCDLCGRDAYTTTGPHRRHPCCHQWRNHIAEGRDCPACLESDKHARELARRGRRP